MNAPTVPSFEARLHQAHLALRAGRPQTAERLLRALEAQAPGELNCGWLLGVALLDQDKVPESVARARARPGRGAGFCQRARGSGARLPPRRRCRARARGGAPGAGEAAAAPSGLARLRRMRSWILRSTRMRAWPSSAHGSPIRNAPVSRRPRRRWSPRIARDPKNSSGRSCSAIPSHVAALVRTRGAVAGRGRAARCRAAAAARPEAVRAPAARLAGDWDLRCWPSGASPRRTPPHGTCCAIEPRQSAELDHARSSVATRLLRQEQALEAYEQAARLQPRGGAAAPLDRARAEDPRPPRRQRGLLQGGARDGSGPGRGLLEPGGPQELRLQRRGDRGHAGSCSPTDRRERQNEAQLHFALGKAFEQRAAVRRVRSPTTRRATRCGASMRPSTSRPSSAARHASARFFSAQFFAARAGAGDPSARRSSSSACHAPAPR